jgi:hypothetical protein
MNERIPFNYVMKRIVINSVSSILVFIVAATISITLGLPCLAFIIKSSVESSSLMIAPLITIFYFFIEVSMYRVFLKNNDLNPAYRLVEKRIRIAVSILVFLPSIFVL